MKKLSLLFLLLFSTSTLAENSYYLPMTTGPYAAVLAKYDEVKVLRYSDQGRRVCHVELRNGVNIKKTAARKFNRTKFRTNPLSACLKRSNAKKLISAL